MRFVTTALVALTIGVLAGLGIAELIAHRQLAAAEAEITELRELNAESTRLLRLVVEESQPPDYKSITGDVWSGDLEDKVFRLCQRVPNDLDATNLFLWARDRIVEFRKDERLSHDSEKPLFARKLFIGYMGEVVATSEGMRFSLMKIQHEPGADILDSTLQWAKEMESRRLAAEEVPTLSQPEQ